MSATRVPKTLMAAALLGAAFSVSANAQTLFTTNEIRNDRELWDDPAYYHNNTVREMRDMDRAGVPGGEGTGIEGSLELASPYPYTSAWEHYRAWLAEANGGTRHTRATVPDWSGRYYGGADRLDGGPNPASSVVPMLKPPYDEYFVQDMWGWAEGRSWGANAFCFPGGFVTAVLEAQEFITSPDRVWILGAGNNRNYTRWIYTDDSGHVEPDYEFPRWHGESIGFWDGDTLVVHTNQIRGWKGGFSEFTDNLQTVERYRRVGDTIEGEITQYDDTMYVRPIYSKLTFERDTDPHPALRPLYNTCTDTNGPSSKIYLDERGLLNERLPGDPLYYDSRDRTPWRTWYQESETRYRPYRQAIRDSRN